MDITAFNLKHYWLSLLAIPVLLLVVFFTPLWLIADLDIRSWILGLPPQLFVSVTWVLGYYFTKDKSTLVQWTWTVGMAPVRVVLECAWFYAIWELHRDFIAVAMVSAIIHFCFLSVPQVLVMRNMSK